MTLDDNYGIYKHVEKIYLENINIYREKNISYIPSDVIENSIKSKKTIGIHCTMYIGKATQQLKVIFVVTDDFEETLKSDYYKDWNITTWSEMQDAFGCDSTDTKANIIYTLNEYAKKFGIWELFPDDDGAIRTEDGDLITYRQLTNEVRKELKRRGLLNG